MRRCGSISLQSAIEEEGYSTRSLEADPTGLIDELLDGVDALLLSPYLDADVRRAFLGAMRNISKAQRIPVLSLSVSLKAALLDELAVSVFLAEPLKELVQEIEAALRRAEAGNGKDTGSGADHNPRWYTSRAKHSCTMEVSGRRPQGED